MKLLTGVLFLFGFACTAFASGTKREIASKPPKVKGIPNSVYSCSSANAEDGYVITIATKKQKTTATVSASTATGLKHLSTLQCQRTKSGVPQPDQIFQTLECENPASDEGYKVEQFAGGFTGFITVDLFQGETQLADDVICQKL